MIIPPEYKMNIIEMEKQLTEEEKKKYELILASRVKSELILVSSIIFFYVFAVPAIYMKGEGFGVLDYLYIGFFWVYMILFMSFGALNNYALYNLFLILGLFVYIIFVILVIKNIKNTKVNVDNYNYKIKYTLLKRMKKI